MKVVMIEMVMTLMTTGIVILRTFGTVFIASKAF